MKTLKIFVELDHDITEAQLLVLGDLIADELLWGADGGAAARSYPDGTPENVRSNYAAWGMGEKARVAKVTYRAMDPDSSTRLYEISVASPRPDSGKYPR